MHIPKFPLPSRPEIEIQFRMPTVADAMAFCDISDTYEERTTTSYLNQMQEGEINDSQLWTAQDRRTALWWIFSSSRIDCVVTYSYKCAFCGEEHYYDLDLRELDQYATLLDREPYIEGVEIPVNGEIYEWRFVPLNGIAMENLEIMRALLPEDRNSKEYKDAAANVRLWEYIYQTELFHDIDPDFQAKANRRYDLIKSMSIDTEFKQLIARIKTARDLLVHGLEIEFDQGVPRLVSPPHYCTKADKEEADRPSTRLLIPFRNHEFFPDL